MPKTVKSKKLSSGERPKKSNQPVTKTKKPGMSKKKEDVLGRLGRVLSCASPDMLRRLVSALSYQDSITLIDEIEHEIWCASLTMRAFVL